MISPNKSILLVSVYFFIFGLLSIFFMKGLNKILGIVMIFYSIKNIYTLKYKGNKRLKLSIIKLNQIIIGSLIIIYSLYILNNNISDNTILVIPLFTILLIINYINIKLYKI